MSKKGFDYNFSRDWFRRKEEDAYSFYDSSRRLFDWDAGRSNGYSSYFVKDNENLKSAAKMVNSMFRVIDVPKGIKMEHSINEKSKTGDVTVQVPLAMLRDDKGNYLNKDTELLDAFYGASIQNAALATMQSKAEYIRTMNARSTKTRTTPQDLLYSILNTERVDKKLAERFPGYSKFVQGFKNYKYDKTYTPLDPEEHAGKRLLELITKFLRYPAHITEEEVEEFKKPIEQIEQYMKKNGFPRTGDDCERQASYMYNVVQKYMEEQQEEDDQPAPSSGDMDALAQQMMGSMMNPGDGDEDDDAFEEEFQDFTDDMEEKRMPSMHHDFTKAGDTDQGNIKWIKADSNKDHYQKELKNIDLCKASVLKTLFARKCKDYKFSMKSMRSGRLDTNKIAEAKQNVPTIYERYGEVKTDKVNIGLLIDESGSMSSDSKIVKARQAAIFMNEVFRKLPDVRLYIYGHTADGGGGGTTGDCIMRIYHEDGKSSDPFTLGSAKARHNNRDGDAIYAAARRIRSQNSNPCLLFVLSDGAPYAYNYDGKAAIADTRKKVTMAQALGFQVIQIAIEEEVPCEEMFDHYIKMTDIKSLPNDLIAYVSRKVDKLVQSKIIM